MVGNNIKPKNNKFNLTFHDSNIDRFNNYNSSDNIKNSLNK